MLDWLRERRLPDLTNIEWTLIGLIAFILILAIWSSGKSEAERNRLIQQCMDDGKKEYECEALLKRPPVPTTIVIPSS